MNKIRVAIIILLAIAALGLWGGAYYLEKGGDENPYGQVQVVETADRTESMTPPAFAKEEFVPVIPSGKEIAQEARIMADGYNDVYTPGKVQDGDVMGPSYWEGVADAYPNTLTAEFEEARTIHALKLLLCPKNIWGSRVQTFKVEYSVDGEQFQELLPEADYKFDPVYGNEVVIEFDAREMKAVRMIFTANTGATGAQVAEWQIYEEE